MPLANSVVSGKYRGIYVVSGKPWWGCTVPTEDANLLHLPSQFVSGLPEKLQSLRKAVSHQQRCSSTTSIGDGTEVTPIMKMDRWVDRQTDMQIDRWIDDRQHTVY